MSGAGGVPPDGGGVRAAPSEVPTGVSAAETRSGRNAGMVAAGIGASRLTGLVRESLIAATLGVSAPADAFRAATRIPNLLQNLLGEGALSASFIPVYSRLLADGRDDEAGRVAGAVAGTLVALTGILAAAAVLLARPLTAALAWGYRGDKFELTVDLVRIVTLGTGFLVLSAWCLGVLNSHRAFFLSYVAPVVWNATQIVVLAAVALRAWAVDDVAVALAWALAVGGLLQLAVQLPAVLRRLGPVRLHRGWGLPAVAEVRHRFGPAVLGRGAAQIGAWLDLGLATLLATGALAALAAAQVLYLLPVSLFAMSVAAAELPELSRDLAAGHPDEAVARTGRALRRILFLVVPTAVAYLTVGERVVAAVFEYRNFDADDTRLVGLVLAAYSLGLVATASSRLLQNTLYARGDVRGPAVIGLYRVVIAATAGVILMFQLDRLVLLDGAVTGWLDLPAAFGPLPADLRVGGLPLRLGAVGLALGSALGAWFELHLLRRRVLLGTGGGRLLGNRLLPLLALAAGGLLLGLGLRVVTAPLPTLPAAAIGLAGLGSSYLLATTALGWPEVAELTGAAGGALRRLTGRRK